MKYCNECKSQECKYIEVNEFFQYIYNEIGKNFKICECPDKTKLGYTCDMVLVDTMTSEKIYVEIKEVKYGFGNVKNSNIAEENGQLDYAKLISEVIEQFDIDKKFILKDFVITIPRSQIGKKDTNLFCGELKEYINATTFREDEYIFIYKRNDDDVKILFNRKTEEIIHQYGDEMLFAYEAEDNNTINSIFKKLTDKDFLKDKIMYNLNHTTKKKFPKEADKKILLNILKLPIGADIFFNMNIKYMIEYLMNESYESNSDANESYLLYFCDEYHDVTKTNDDTSIENIGKVLFIIPLISEWMQKAIVYQLA